MHRASFWIAAPVMMFAAASAPAASDAGAAPLDAGAEWEYLDAFDHWVPGTFPLCEPAVSCDQPAATCYRNLTSPGAPLGCGESKAEVFTSSRCALLRTTARRRCP
jgi:hypothetical protein